MIRKIFVLALLLTASSTVSMWQRFIKDTGSTIMTTRQARCAMLSGKVSWIRSIVLNNRNTRKTVNCLAIRTDIAIFAKNHQNSTEKWKVTLLP